MKKLILLLATISVMVACGKKTETDNEQPKEAKKNQYSVVLDAVLEKNDTCLVMIYDDNKFEVLNQRVVVPVTGSTSPQKIVFNLKLGYVPVNLGVAFSTSKGQKQIKINSISVKNNDKDIYNPGEYAYYFSNNDQMVMDLKTYVHQLKHDKEYPPSFIGNDKLAGAIVTANE